MARENVRDHGNVLEVVVYTLNDGVSHDDFVRAYDELSAWISQKPGFVSREVMRGTADGKWIELVYWDDLASAEAVAADSVSAPECAPFFAVVDMASALLLYGEPGLPLVGAAKAAAGSEA